MGDKLSMQTFNPDSIYGLDLLYASIPFDILFKVLESRQLYIMPGLSADLLLKANELAWWVQDKHHADQRNLPREPIFIGFTILQETNCTPVPWIGH